MKLNVVKNEDLGKKLVKDFKNGKVNKSDSIRGLFDLGYEVKEISSELNIIYNMCFNVINKYMLKSGLEDKIVREKKKNFSDELIEFMNGEGKDMKKSEVVKKYLREGRGEGYIYSNIKKLVEEGKISFK